MKQKEQHGFTLLELLVVIAIIGLLSTIAFVSLNRARVKARNAKAAADARNLYNAFTLYASEHDGAFPKSRRGGYSPACILETPGGPLPAEFSCRGTDNNDFCGANASISALCSAVPACLSTLGTDLAPYISISTIISPVITSFASGARRFLYLSHAEQQSYNGQFVEAGAYIAWFKDECVGFAQGECPGILLRSNCGNTQNGCALFLGKSTEPPPDIGTMPPCGNFEQRNFF